MEDREEIIQMWTKAGGLLTKKMASDILGVNKSVMSKRKDFKTYRIGKNEFLSFNEVINREDIKPRKKKI